MTHNLLKPTMLWKRFELLWVWIQNRFWKKQIKLQLKTLSHAALSWKTSTPLYLRKFDRSAQIMVNNTLFLIFWTKNGCFKNEYDPDSKAFHDHDREFWYEHITIYPCIVKFYSAFFSRFFALSQHVWSLSPPGGSFLPM